MRSRILGETGRGSAILLAVVLALGIALAGWKTASARATAAAAAHQPGPNEMVTSAVRDVAQAQIARTQAIIAKKTIRAPFRARVGISDVHPGQYLNEGTQLTTLQGIDGAVHVDFAVSQQVAVGLRAGTPIQVVTTADSTPIAARIVAVY